MSAHARMTLVIAAGIAMAIGAVALSIRSCGEKHGNPESARLDIDHEGRPVLVLVDHLPDDEYGVDRTTRVDALNGQVLSRDSVDLDGSIHGAPEQYCAHLRQTNAGSPTLRLGPYSGQIGYQDGAETPAGTLTIDAKLEAWGFLTMPETDTLITVGDDVLMLHDRPFDGTRPAGGERESWITRLDRTAHPVWTRRLAGGCQLATREDDLLVIAMKDGEHRAIALDLATGAVRWELAY